MFFEKPDIRYVDMCIYIDENVYRDDCDQALIYEYLYHIVRMLAVKRCYFKTVRDTEDFSLFAASQYFLRLTDERQFEDNPPIEPVRSILNYVRKTLYSYRNEYAKKYFSENDIIANVDVVSLDLDDFKCFVSAEIDPINKCDFNHYLGDIKSTIQEVLTHIPYKRGTAEWNNIYLSCLLSFLNSVTLRNKDIKRLKSFKRSTSLTDTLLNNLYLKERYNSTILYHLDDSMYNYITVLTNRIRRELSRELSLTLHRSTPTCTTMKNLLMAAAGEQEEYSEY